MPSTRPDRGDFACLEALVEKGSRQDDSRRGRAACSMFFQIDDLNSAAGVLTQLKQPTSQTQDTGKIRVSGMIGTN
jgi:hypothetical protein